MEELNDMFIISAIYLSTLIIFAIIFVVFVVSCYKERTELVKMIASKSYTEYASFNVQPEEKQVKHASMIENQLKKMKKPQS